MVSASARARMSEGGARGRARTSAEATRLKEAGLSAAISWRERRRCDACGALAYLPCAHRPDGFGTVAVSLREEWPLP